MAEHDFIEASGNLLPLALRGLVQLVGVSVEALVEQANEEQRLVSAAGSHFSEPLQQEHIMPLLMGATMVIQMRLTPQPSVDNAQAKQGEAAR